MRGGVGVALRCPEGGAGGWLPADLAATVPGGGAYLLCRLPSLPLVCFSAPIPPTPFPSGEGGESKFSYAGGCAPCIPGAEPGRHRLFLWKAVLLAFRGKFSIAGKESNAARDANTIGDYPCRTPTPQVQQVPHGFRLRGCKGRSPLHNITLSLPLPAGKGAGGMGAKFFFYPKNPAGRSSQCRTGSSRIQNPQQKRLSRFCKTQNPSRHPTQQGNHRSGRQRKSPAK